MKKISILFLLILILGTVFTSCSNEEENGPVDMGIIEGKWNFNKSGYTKGIISGSVNYSGNVDGCEKDYIEIKAAGIVKLGDYTKDCVFTESTGTWSQDGNSITVVVDGSAMTGTFEISTLTAAELVLKKKNEEGATLSQSFTKG